MLQPVNVHVDKRALRPCVSTPFGAAALSVSWPQSLLQLLLWPLLLCPFDLVVSPMALLASSDRRDASMACDVTQRIAVSECLELRHARRSWIQEASDVRSTNER